MEVIVFIALALVIVAKAFTANRLTHLESQIRQAQAEETDVSDRLQSTETALRQLEKEKSALEQEIKHLENDRDLASLEVTKLGGSPITEEQVDKLLSAQQAPPPTAPPKEDTDQTKGSDPEQEEHHEKAPEADVLNTSAKSPGDKKERYRILVVDDNTELRSLLLQALEDEYDVLQSPDGFDALTKIVKEKQEYGLIITDLNMPNVNGITLVEHLPTEIPTIVISAFVNKPEFKEALSRLKPSDILEKPFQMAKLRQSIKKALSS